MSVFTTFLSQVLNSLEKDPLSMIQKTIYYLWYPPYNHSFSKKLRTWVKNHPLLDRSFSKGTYTRGYNCKTSPLDAMIQLISGRARSIFRNIDNYYIIIL
jgi:hypothetical protein